MPARLSSSKWSRRWPSCSRRSWTPPGPGFGELCPAAVEEVAAAPGDYAARAAQAGGVVLARAFFLASAGVAGVLGRRRPLRGGGVGHREGQDRVGDGEADGEGVPGRPPSPLAACSTAF